jgi:integrase
MREKELPLGEKVRESVFSPHSMRATTATLLLVPGVPIESLQKLLDHKHIATTQIYDKRRRSVQDSRVSQGSDLRALPGLIGLCIIGLSLYKIQN